MKSITSSSNSDFKIFQALASSTGIKKHGLALISGKKIVEEALKNPSIEAHSLLTVDTDPAAETYPNRVTLLTKELFNQLDQFGTHSPLLVIKTQPLKTWENSPPEGINVFLALQDPANLGAAIRTSQAFNAQCIVLLNEACHPLHPKVTRTSTGANLTAPLFKGPSIKELSGEFVSLDMHGKDIGEFSWPKNVNLVIGEEGQGVPEKMRGNSIRIPISDKVESLNAYASLSIALFHYQLNQSSS